MGADGCDRVQGAQGYAQTRQTYKKNDLTGIFVTLWSGKFPRTICFGRSGEKVFKCMKMGNGGLVWAWVDAGHEGSRKTR